MFQVQRLKVDNKKYEWHWHYPSQSQPVDTTILHMYTGTQSNEVEYEAEQDHSLIKKNVVTDNHTHHALHCSTRLRSAISIQHRTLTRILRLYKLDANLSILTVDS
jgi:hypothetical protein